MSGEKSFGVRLTTNERSFVAGMNRAEAATASFAKTGAANMQAAGANLEKTGAKMQRAGSMMTKSITLPIVAAGAASIKAAIDWESSWAGVSKTVNGTTAQMANLQDELRGMARELPASHSAIAAVAEAAGQLGVGVEDISSFTRVMIDLGETTNLSSDEAATSIAQMMNVMGTAPEKVGNLGAALVSLGNNGASTERDIVQMAQRIAGAGAIIGLSEADVLGMANALASAGIEVEAGGSAMSTIMIDMAKAVSTGSAELGVFAQVAGMTAGEFQTAFKTDAAGAVASFVEGLGAMNAAGGDVFSTLSELGMSDVRVTRALLSMATSGDMFRESIELGSVAFEENTALAEEAGKRYETSASKIAVMRNEIVDVAIDLGEKLLPVVLGVMGAIRDLAEWFAELPGPVQAVVVALVGMAAAAGPLIYLIGTLLKNFVLVKAALVGLSTFAAAHPLIALATAIGAVVVATGLLESGASASETAIKSLGESMRAAATDAEGLAHWLAEVVADDALFAAMDAAGVTMDELSAAVVKGGDDYQLMVDRIVQGGKDAGLSTDGLLNDQKRLGLILAGLPGLSEAAAAAEEQRARVMGEVSEAADGLVGGMAAAEDAAIAQEVASTAVADAVDDEAAAVEALTPLWGDLAGLMDIGAEATQDATDALNANIEALEKDLAAMMALVDYARGTADAQFALTGANNDYARFLEDLPGKIDEISKSKVSEAEKNRQLNELYIEGAQLAGAVGDAIGEAYEQATDGAFTATQKGDEFRKSMINSALAASGPARQAILDYVFAINEVPEDKQTLIEAEVDAGSAETAAALLNETSATRDAEVIADADAAALAETQGELAALEDPLSAEVTVTADTNAAAKAIQLLLGMAQATQDAVRRAGAAAAGGAYTAVPEKKESAEGRYVPAGANLLSTFGEQGPEAILPLDKLARLKHLLADPRIGGPIMRALGLDGSGGQSGGTAGASDFMRSLHGSGALSTSAMSDFLGANGMSWQPPSAAAAAPDAGAEDDVMANRFAQGDLSAEAYDEYLAAREASEVRFSNAQNTIWAKRQALQRDAAAVAQGLLDAEQQAKDDALAAEDQRMAALHELGLISNADYARYLTNRQQSYTQYSAEWMAITRQIAQMQKEEQQAQIKAMEDQAAAAAKAIALVFATARAQKDLADAIIDVEEATAAQQQAEDEALWKQNSPEYDANEKAAAWAKVEAAKRRTAEALFEGAKARASAAGLETGTPAWAAYVRREVTNYIAGHPEWAALLSAELAEIPHFDRGGVIRPRVGGTLSLLAERGEAEHVLRDSRVEHMESMLAAMSTTPTTTASFASPTSTSGSPLVQADVRVFLGTREITDVIRVEIDQHDRDTRGTIRAGRR